MKALCGVFALILTMISCKEKESLIDVKKVDDKKYSIDLVNAPQRSLNLDSLIAVKSFVKMSTTSDPNSLLVDFSKVIVKDSFIFVLDVTFSGLKVFDKKGRFIKLVGNIGQGPGEYVGLNDFEIKQDTIRVLTKMQQLIEYDLQGNYLDTKRIDMFAWNFASTRTGYVFFKNYNVENTDGTSYNLAITNKTFNVISSGAPFSEKAENIPTFAYTGFLSSENNEIMFSEPFSSDVYTLEGDSLQRKYMFEFGSSKKPDNVDLAKIHSERMNPAHLHNRIFEIEDFVFFKYFIAPRLNLGIFDKKKQFFYPSSNFDTESYLSFILSVPNARIDANAFIEILSVDLIMYLQKDEKFLKLVKTQNPDFHKIISDYKTNDNPLLVTFMIRGNQL